MPAFGSNGIVNLDKREGRVQYQLVKPDGTIVASSFNKNELTQKQNNLSQSVGCALQIIEKKMECI